MVYRGVRNIFSVVEIFSGLIKILFSISLIGVVVGFAMYIRDIFFERETDKNKTGSSDTTPNDLVLEKTDKVGQNSDKEKVLKESCPACGRELKAEWQCCPICGGERANTEHSTELNNGVAYEVEIDKVGTVEEVDNAGTIELEARNEEANISDGRYTEKSEETGAVTVESIENSSGKSMLDIENTIHTDVKDSTVNIGSEESKVNADVEEPTVKIVMKDSQPAADTSRAKKKNRKK